MFLKSDNASIMMTAFGDGPRTIVAHGGWVGSGELWLPVFEHLSRHWRTVTYDHRGTGATISTAPRITFELLVDDLFRVLDSLEIETCVLAGESAGAAIVLEAALRQPSRFDGLVIIDGRYVGERSTQLDKMLQGCRSDFHATMDAFVNACVPEDECEAERAWGRLIVKRSNGKAAVELMECLDGIDIASRLPALTIPTLAIHGSRDAIAPLASSQRLVSLMPCATLAIAEGAGHVPTITRPDWVAQKIEQFVAATV
ncbi:MAG TPA: alpha/beta hydrolase [Rhizobiaceae bacterium]|nr:alpha/beta hydrolase [Rhizobiaceae bacterium]